MRLYDGFEFAPYFNNYIKKHGITKKYISEILEVPYSTLRSKFLFDSFTYAEICFLDTFFSDLLYWHNRVQYLNMRYKAHGIDMPMG